MKEPLLFLCHRIPYPPNKGDKIRAFHLLKFLSQYFDVHLGTFVDDPDDWAYEADLDIWCETTKLIPLNPKTAKIRSLKGMLVRQPLTLPFYQSNDLQSWVDDMIQHRHIRKALVFSAAMAQFISSDKHAKHLEKRVVDIVDIDSDKWQQYAEQKSWPMSWVYKREAKTLFLYEQAIARQFDRSFFVSSTESQDFIDRAPSTGSKVSFFNNGVDHRFFATDNSLTDPYANNSPIRFVFTGAMDYWPNVDAVVWFVEAVLPKIQAIRKDAVFAIVGGKRRVKVVPIT